MSESTTSSLNPMAREFTPSPVQKPEPSVTTHVIPVWSSNATHPATSYHHNAEVAHLQFLHEQEQAYYPVPQPSCAGFATPTLPGPALFEAMPPFFFEDALRHTRSQANILAKESAYVTGDAMMAKLASASMAFLHSLGYVRTYDANFLKQVQTDK